MVELGNFGQDEATVTTILQRWESSAQVDVTFNKLKNDNTWTFNAKSSEEKENKKMMVSRMLFKDRFVHYVHFD